MFFWNSWSRTDRLIYFSALVFLFAGFSFFTVAWLRGLGNVIRWAVLSELFDLPTTVRTFTDGLLDYPIRGTVYAVSEQFVASAMTVPGWLAPVMLAGIWAGLSLILAALTRLPRTMYLIGMAVFLLFLAACRFETLEVPGLPKQAVFLVLAAIFGAVSYYFHAFRSDLFLPIRVAVFAALTGAVMPILGAVSPVPNPALTVISYALPGLLTVSTGFVLFIGFEIIAGLVWLTSASRTDDSLAPKISSGRSLGINNLLFVSGLYLFNLVLLWLNNTRAIDWNGFLISPFFIYLISIVLGIWGFRRLIRQQDVFSFRDAGAPLYVGLALMSTLTIGFAFTTANDPLIEVFEDVIVYGHLAMGVVFLIYVAFNFLPFYRQGRPVHLVLYQPKRSPLFVFRAVGLALFLGFMSNSNFFPIKQATAGYYNALGDLYSSTNEPVSAAAFYQLSLGQEYQNHKANYALASLAMARNDLTTAAFFFNQALLKQPSPQAFSGLSSTYQQTNLFFEAIKTLQRGLNTFPKSGELQNNLGYLYSKTSVADSAYFYFASAATNAGQTDVPKTNLLALFAKNPQVLAADSSLATNTNESTYPSYQANALALKCVAGRDTTAAKRPDWLADKTRADERIELNVGQFASLYNAGLLIQNPDTALAGTLRRRGDNPLNQAFTDDLLLARVFADYRGNRFGDAIGSLDGLVSESPRNADLRRMLGLLLLEQGLFPKAAQTLELNSDTLSIYYRALALTKAGSLSAARPLWEIAAQQDRVLAALKAVLYQERLPADDLEKAFYVTYRPDDPNRGRVWETIQNPNLKTVSGAALVDGFLKNKQVFYAQMIVSQMGKPDQLSPFARSVENVSALKIAVAKNNRKAADAMAKQPVVVAHRADRARLLAEVYTKTNQPKLARAAWNEARQLAPLNAIIATGAANFYQSQKQPEAAYKLALNALTYNPADPELLKTYIRLCLDLSLFDYADDALLQLEFATPRADYQAFLADYQQKIASIEKTKSEFTQ